MTVQYRTEYWKKSERGGNVSCTADEADMMRIVVQRGIARRNFEFPANEKGRYWASDLTSALQMAFDQGAAAKAEEIRNALGVKNRRD